MRADQLANCIELADFTFWDTHPNHSLEDWQYEVANGDTRLGYWDWVLCQMDQAGDDDE